MSFTVSGDPSLLHLCAVQSAHPGQGSPVLSMLPHPLVVLSSWTLALLSTLLAIVTALLYVLFFLYCRQPLCSFAQSLYFTLYYVVFAAASS